MRKPRSRLIMLSVSAAVILIVTVIIACADHEGKKLRTIDFLLDTDLDSAVMMLKTLDTTHLSAKDKAYRDLLLVRSYFYTRNHALPDTLPDSSLRIIMNGNDPDLVQEAYLWSAHHNFYTRNFIGALIDLDKSVYLLPKTRKNSEEDKIILKGHSFSLMYSIWQQLGDLSQARIYNDSAINCYSCVQKGVNMKFRTYLTTANILVTRGKNVETIRLLDSLRMLHEPYVDNFKDNYELAKVIPLLNLGKTDSAREILNRLSGDSINADSKFIMYGLALLNYKEGNYEKATRHITDLRNLTGGVFGDEYDPLRYLKLHKDIEMALGNYSEALSKQDTIAEYYSSIYFNDSKNIAANAIKIYQTGEKENAEHQARMSRMITVLIIISSVFVISILATVTVLIIRNNREKKNLLLSQLNDLKIKDEERRQNIRALVGSRFDTMNRLCEDYLELSDLKDRSILKNELFKNLSAQIAEIRNPKFKSRLEESINRDFDGLYDRFKDLPDISDEDRTLFLYFSAGFAVKAVGVFMNLKKSSVYTRRRRLRETIEQSDSPFKEEFLKFL